VGPLTSPSPLKGPRVSKPTFFLFFSRCAVFPPGTFSGCVRSPPLIGIPLFFFCLSSSFVPVRGPSCPVDLVPQQGKHVPFEGQAATFLSPSVCPPRVPPLVSFFQLSFGAGSCSCGWFQFLKEPRHAEVSRGQIAPSPIIGCGRCFFRWGVVFRRVLHSSALSFFLLLLLTGQRLSWRFRLGALVIWGLRPLLTSFFLSLRVTLSRSPFPFRSHA